MSIESAVFASVMSFGMRVWMNSNWVAEASVSHDLSVAALVGVSSRDLT